MRQATRADCAAAIKACQRMLAKSPGHQMKYADEPVAIQYLERACAEGNAIVVDGYFIMYSVGPAWFSSVNFLIEDLIIRIERTDKPVEVAIAALDKLREMFGCVAIVAGDTQIGHMTPKYIASGYKPLGTQLMKE